MVYWNNYTKYNFYNSFETIARNKKKNKKHQIQNKATKSTIPLRGSTLSDWKHMTNFPPLNKIYIFTKEK